MDKMRIPKKDPITEAGIVIRPTLRLTEIENLIKIHRLIQPPLSRATLVKMCEEIFETVGDAPTSLGWLVFEDSFLEWVRSIQDGSLKKDGHERK